ncbi:hypothetical protein BATDEDRAFT_87229 [Batrachochytrium dendrobatidis JAM81]|uniref:Oxidation resistance protein 1 n=2 Tax=Batrachochytrium dendrobatidis TaxID=109871 RepID=F4NYN6_BATDJ|nr:uncharacterized protein BATDEDRAFT_87229 [Batrachochytrium dendrobatidis JAM81]EGF81739.1 hypothetical protein BATDEDRAFT_87229 [Batrachochytrium dendrobatidis JAM81]KAJ8324856.1 oxidation resistance protein 1 [Batrachochytrium dendrobatidis]KAK5671096.1 oxidation resistance protein 1 [Batrachochytrium dendrobatidis]OAJ40210.1 hypothetical protein BDEG_23973 [Batrachochytrium dendrobatidis JEL423]|eukprot:XP_006677512.1 hypothetical protein BATDEDRAFT_87229 [Batrachochytrium dendrobatidis JAM81]
MPPHINRHISFFKNAHNHIISPTAATPATSNNNGESSYSPISPLSPTKRNLVRLTGRNEHTLTVLDPAIAEILRDTLPPLQREADSWQLRYSTDQHGMSLQTLFTRANESTTARGAVGFHGPVMLVIRDVYGAIFGAFLSEPPARHKGFYGNGSCFLWKQQHHPNHTDSGSKTISLYMATGNDDYFMLSESGAELAFGAGDGKFGLWIDSQINMGHSETCSTFLNAPLATTPGSFQIDALELWSFNL